MSDTNKLLLVKVLLILLLFVTSNVFAVDATSFVPPDVTPNFSTGSVVSGTGWAGYAGLEGRSLSSASYYGGTIYGCYSLVGANQVPYTRATYRNSWSGNRDTGWKYGEIAEVYGFGVCYTSPGGMSGSRVSSKKW